MTTAPRVTEPAATAADVATAIAALPGGTRFVGIDGPGAAGKTALAGRVAGLLHAEDVRVDVVHVDDFPPTEPDGEWDWDRLRAQLLLPLLAGRGASYQVWQWGSATGGAWVDVRPGGVVLIEGVSSTRREVGAPWALTVWVEAPPDVRRARALERDGEDMWPTWRDRWIPSEEAYFAREHPAERADLVVPGTS